MSNLSDLLNPIIKDSADATKDFVSVAGNIMGTLADASGVLGIIETLLNIGQPSMSDINDAIQNGFTQLDKKLNATYIVDRNGKLNKIYNESYLQLQGLKEEIDAQPSPAEVTEYIQPCIKALDDLSGRPLQPDIVWNVPVDWPVYWTDDAEYISMCYLTNGWLRFNASYGPQIPPVNPDGETVFYYVYCLPLYLFALSTFLAVARALEPDFVAKHADVIRSAAGLLKEKHDQINSGIVKLVPPNWAQKDLPELACTTTGMTAVNRGNTAVAVAIEYGAVEKYSGYSSVGDSYQINWDDRGRVDPATYQKWLIRQLKRTMDVYVGIGLRDVWQVINKLNALVGDPSLGGNFGDWSIRRVAHESAFDPDGTGFRLRSLGQLIIGTQPFDTPYAPGATSFSLRTLLTNFSH